MADTVIDPNHLQHLNYEELHGGALPGYQAEGIAAMLATGRTLNADPPGAGKTVQMAGTIAGYVELGRTTPQQPALVVTASEDLAAQTARELARFTTGLDVASLGDHPNLGPNTTEHMWNVAIDAPAHIKVMTYNQLRTRMAGWTGRAPSAVFLDEAQALKGEGENYEAVERLLNPATQRIHLFTATPYENEPREMYRLYSLLGMLPLMPTRAEFDKLYVEWLDYGKGRRQARNWLNDNAARWFAQVVAPYTIRRPAEVIAASGLPRPREVRHVEWLELTPEQAAVMAVARTYDEQKKVVVGETAGDSVRAVRAAQRVVDILASDPITKVLLVARSLTELATVARLLTEAGVAYAELQGITKDRDATLGDFRSSTEVRVLIGSEVAEVGLNLQVCEHLVSVGIPDTDARVQQRIGRVARPGSPHAEVHHHVALTNSAFDLATRDRVQRKAINAAMVAAS